MTLAVYDKTMIALGLTWAVSGLLGEPEDPKGSAMRRKPKNNESFRNLVGWSWLSTNQADQVAKCFVICFEP